MTRARKICLGIFAISVLGGVLFVWTILDTWRKLPEAYAAWDVGTMLVCFMERNDNHWPKSWDELTASLEPDDECVFCRGVADGNDRHAGYPKTIDNIKQMVRMDRDYLPKPGVMRYPITTINGQRFSVVWSGAEPNEMVYNWITHRVKETNAPF